MRGATWAAVMCEITPEGILKISHLRVFAKQPWAGLMCDANFQPQAARITDVTQESAEVKWMLVFNNPDNWTSILYMRTWWMKALLYLNKAPVCSSANPPLDAGRAHTLNIHCNPTLEKENISWGREHILQCDVDLVSSPSLQRLCFLC